VYSRKTGLLVSVDPELESQVRLEAEGELLEEASRSGILVKAQENARSALTAMLLGLGFEKVAMA
jgi:parvulin-like peptidyl-prolyl isomerase